MQTEVEFVRGPADGERRIVPINSDTNTPDPHVQWITMLHPGPTDLASPNFELSTTTHHYQLTPNPTEHGPIWHYVERTATP